MEMESSEKIKDRTNGFYRLERLRLGVLAILTAAVLICSIALVFLARSNHLMETRLSCRGTANEHIQAAVGKGLVAVAQDDGVRLKEEALNVLKGVRELEDCDGGEAKG